MCQWGRLVVICTQLWSNIYQIGLLTRNTSLLLLVRDKLTDVLARQPCRPSVKPNYISLTEFNYYNLEKVQLLQPASDFDLVQYGFMLCCGSKPSNPFKTGNSKSSLHAQLVLWKLGRISSFIVMSFWRSPYTTWEKIYIRNSGHFPSRVVNKMRKILELLGDIAIVYK